METTETTYQYTLKSTFATFLRERRKELNLTLQELAVLVYNNGGMRTELSKFELEKKAPSFETLERIMNALNSECVFRVKK